VVSRRPALLVNLRRDNDVRTIFLLSLLAASPAFADATDTFQLTPATVSIHQMVVLQVDSDDGCYEADSGRLEQNGRHIDVVLTLADYSPCQPTWRTPRVFSLGTYLPGTYTVRVTECINAPIDPCTLHSSLTLEVSRATDARPVPAVSWASLLVLASMMGLAVRRYARR
jgi:hypothetical protein